MKALGRARRRTLLVAISAFAVSATWLVVGGAGPAQATVKTLATFNVHGAYTWTVPAGVTKITFDVFGASGGNVVSGPPVTLVSVGGAGGEALGTFKVKAGETFYVVVGAVGANNNGQNGSGTLADPGGMPGQGALAGYLGGAGGGGTSYVAIGGFSNQCANSGSCSPFDRIIVGGGGGGGGQNSNGGVGGAASGGAGSSSPTTGVQEGFRCLFSGIDPPPGALGCFLFGGYGTAGSGAGGGGGGWFGGNYGASLGGGGGGSGYISPLALKGSFPGKTHGGDGLVVITTP